jgi:hypothetical protein
MHTYTRTHVRMHARTHVHALTRMLMLVQICQIQSESSLRFTRPFNLNPEWSCEPQTGFVDLRFVDLRFVDLRFVDLRLMDLRFVDLSV